MTTYPSPDHWLTTQAATVPEAAELRRTMDAMRSDIERAEKENDELVRHYPMLSGKERNQASKDLGEVYRLRIGKDGGFPEVGVVEVMNAKSALENAYALINGLENRVKDAEAKAEQSYAAGARDGQLAERQANEATVAELRAELERHKKFVAAYDNRYSKDKDSFVKVLEAREELDSESVSQ